MMAKRNVKLYILRVNHLKADRYQLFPPPPPKTKCPPRFRQIVMPLPLLLLVVCCAVFDMATKTR